MKNKKYSICFCEEILYSYGKQNFVFTKHNKGNKEK